MAQAEVGEYIIHVDIRPPLEGEHASYHVISCTYAEWPLVEAVVRVVLVGALRIRSRYRRWHCSGSAAFHRRRGGIAILDF